MFTYRLFDLQTVTFRGAEPLKPGRHELRFDFDYDGAGYAKGAAIQLLVDGVLIGKDHLPASPPAFYTIEETFDVGIDHGASAGDYPEESAPGYTFTGGRIEEVSIELR
ncbi:hypothetical protein D3C87_1120140 [compost metagenome]